jgi:peptide/nickel transport system ATP-binding protein
LASLDPRVKVAASVAEPLRANRIGSAAERRQRVLELLERVGLPTELGNRFPGALSGGERQKVAVARALASEPELLVLDEPLSSLDLTVQVQILELLAELKRDLGLTIVMVTHDLSLVRQVCDRVAVMRAGRVVEEGETDTVLDHPGHEATAELVDAVPWSPILGGCTA